MPLKTSISLLSAGNLKVEISIDSFDPSAVSHQMYRTTVLPDGDINSLDSLIDSDVNPGQIFEDLNIQGNTTYYYQLVSGDISYSLITEAVTHSEDYGAISVAPTESFDNGTITE